MHLLLGHSKGGKMEQRGLRRRNRNRFGDSSVLDAFFDRSYLAPVFDDFVDNMNSMFGGDDAFSIIGTYPKINLIKTPTKLVVEATVPGMRKDEISVEFSGGQLTISGKASQNSDYNDGSFVTREVKRSSFKRTIVMPRDFDETFDSSAVIAKMDAGILTIEIPRKHEEEKPEAKKVDIQ